MIKKYSNLDRATNRILIALLGILGFSCSNDEPREEYGMPYAKYEIKGKVVNKSNIGIPDIQVTTTENMNISTKKVITTNNLGEFTVTEGQGFPQTVFDFTAEDVDGTKNGSYKTGSAQIKNIPLTGGSGWYSGEGKAEVTIELQEDVK